MSQLAFEMHFPKIKSKYTVANREYLWNPNLKAPAGDLAAIKL